MRRAIFAVATLVVALVLASSAMAAMFGGRDRSSSQPAATPEPTPYCKGYKDGFRRGYCGNDASCLGETKYCRGERSSPPTYEAGYARGFKLGKAWKLSPASNEPENWQRNPCGYDDCRSPYPSPPNPITFPL